MKAYSLDFREKIMDAHVMEGVSVRKVEFGLCPTGRAWGRSSKHRVIEAAAGAESGRPSDGPQDWLQRCR
jgi:transposase